MTINNQSESGIKQSLNKYSSRVTNSIQSSTKNQTTILSKTHSRKTQVQTEQFRPNQKSSKAMNFIRKYFCRLLVVLILLIRPSMPQCTSNIWLTNDANGLTLSCNACAPSYYLFSSGTIPVGGVDTAIYNCYSCEASCLTCSSTLSCDTCPTTSYPSGLYCNSCVNLANNCLQCTATGCTVCYPPFTLSSGNCLLNCPNLYGTQCVQCDTSQCGACNTGYAIDPTQTCVLCSVLPNCQNCSNGPICTGCQPNFFLNSSDGNLSCVTCSLPNCASCANGPVCISCDTNFFIDFSTGNKSCALCMILNCANCTHGPSCATCDSSYYLNFSNANKSCVLCDFPNCATCTDGPVCLTCQPNYYLQFSTNNKSCTQCSITNCLQCKHGPECIQCEQNHIFSAFSPWNSCIPCPFAHYSSLGLNQCLACPTYCTYCYETATGYLCRSCQVGYTTDQVGQSCVKCSSLMAKCQQCQNIYVCTLCEYPYIVGSTNICDKCEAGFQYVLGQCIKPFGCQNSLPDFSKCLACFSSLNFVYNTQHSACECKFGHYPTKVRGFTECVNKCGDGILIGGVQDCDDGNVRNNDGCSAQCKRESGFTCTPDSPSFCTLHYTPEKFIYNYAYRYEGQNKCLFSLSLEPAILGLKYINWLQYLTFNVSDDMIVKNSKLISYHEETNQLTIELEYLKSLEELTIEFKLSKNKQSLHMARSSSSNEMKNKNDNQNNQTLGHRFLNSQISKSVGSSLNTHSDLLIQLDISLIVNLKGINSKLIYEENSLLTALKSASITSLIITILILLQFFVGSYFHKMIGLETIQMLQFFYFVRVIIQENLSTFLNAMNVFKYTAYGGYANYEAVYGSENQEVQSLTFMTVGENFVTVGLMKYFSLNVNISLVVPALVILGFLFSLTRKYVKRNQYLKTLDQAQKDQYTVLCRSCLWVYDHFVFPYLNVFNMIVFFSTILYLQSLPTASSAPLEDSQLNKFIEMTSFSPHLLIAFMTFLIFCSEVFGSYDEFKHSRLTEQEKARVPKSLIEKLEHDENNPDRPNYKPGYVLFYLLFYLVIEIILMLNVLLPSLKDFGVEIMTGVSFVYLVFIWTWKPYHEAVEFHNKALRLNHLTVLLFMVGIVVTKRVQMNATFYVAFIYVILCMLAVVAVCGYLRIVVEYKFRKKFLDNPILMETDIKTKKGKFKLEKDQKLEKKDSLLKNNPFVFENQVKDFVCFQNEKDFPVMTQEKMNEIKQKIRRQIYAKERVLNSKIRKKYVFEQSPIIQDLSTGQFKPKKSNDLKVGLQSFTKSHKGNLAQRM